MQVTKNEHSGNTQVVVDDLELSLIGKAVWDEQLLYHSLLGRECYVDFAQKKEWKERLQQLRNIAMLLGVNVVEEV